MRKTAGSIIKDRRSQLKVSLGSMAKRTRCSDSHLSDVEHGKRRPTERMITRLARVLRLDFLYLCLIFGRVPDNVRRRLIVGDFRPLERVATRYRLELKKAEGEGLTTEKVAFEIPAGKYRAGEKFELGKQLQVIEHNKRRPTEASGGRSK